MLTGTIPSVETCTRDSSFMPCIALARHALPLWHPFDASVSYAASFGTASLTGVKSWQSRVSSLWGSTACSPIVPRCAANTLVTDRNPPVQTEHCRQRARRPLATTETRCNVGAVYSRCSGNARLAAIRGLRKSKLMAYVYMTERTHDQLVAQARIELATPRSSGECSTN